MSACTDLPLTRAMLPGKNVHIVFSYGFIGVGWGAFRRPQHGLQLEGRSR